MSDNTIFLVIFFVIATMLSYGVMKRDADRCYNAGIDSRDGCWEHYGPPQNYRG